ncbi:MAG: hypothetical protein HY371_13835, partial [Devosia nanyangense]|nr:hypothetical protein [Devosia nanyangense]
MTKGWVRGLAAAAAVSIASVTASVAWAADVKIAMILPGPITDNDWNSVGYNG